MKRIAVLASGSGTDFQAVCDACIKGEIPARVVLLIYDRKEAFVKERAAKLGIPAVYLNKFMFKKDTRDSDTDDNMLALLKEYDTDCVVLAGYLSKVGEKTVTAYKNRMVNTHPALIPSFCGMGMYGHHVHEAVVASGVKVTGCTIHLVDNNMDTGPIILQETVPVEYNDTPDDVAKRVLEVEHRILPRAVALLVQERVIVHGNRTEILPR